MQLSPYLYFNGQCEEAFKFYERCLGGNGKKLNLAACASLCHGGRVSVNRIANRIFPARVCRTASRGSSLDATSSLRDARYDTRTNADDGAAEAHGRYESAASARKGENRSQ